MDENKNNLMRILVFGIFIILYANTAGADSQTLIVGSCSYAGCSAAGWNDQDNTNDGSTLPQGTTDSLTLTNPTFDSRSNISGVDVWHSHGGEGGIKLNLTYTFRNGANTITYCTSSIANTASYRYDNITPSSCNWTFSRLQDLVIDVSNPAAANKNEYNDYLYFNINFTPYSDTDPPTIVLGNPVNNTFKTNSNVSFYFTPTEENTITNCSLMLNGTQNRTIYSPIPSGVQTSIWSIIYDGYWEWTINCTDSWNNTGTNSTLKTVKIDTKPPGVYLETPNDDDEWTASPDVDFTFNASDAMTNLFSCELILDGASRLTNNSPVEQQTMTFNFAPGNGQHNWSVNCTDSNGFENTSLTYNLSVNFADESVTTNKGSYEQGENVTISGSQWNDGIITIELKLPNSTVESWNTTASSGAFVTSYFLNYSHPTGQYNITAYEYALPFNNASKVFTVINRNVQITIEKQNYYQGEKVLINGTGFSPDNTVSIEINWSGGSNVTNVTSDPAGAVEFNYSIKYMAALGVYNVSIYDFTFQNLNDTGNFTVLSRIADISTDFSSYASDKEVLITGLLYTILGTVNLTIFQNSSGAAAPFFPDIIITNSSGGFNYTWNTTDTCPGVYGVSGYDLNNTFLNDTYYFNLTGTSAGYSYSPALCIDSDPSCTLVNLLTADDSLNESLTVDDNTPANNYIIINFSYGVANDSDITFARFSIKHYRESPNANFNALEWFNKSSGAYQAVSCPLISTTTPDVNTLEYCNLNNQIKNGLQANDISIRLTYARSGAGGIIRIDYANMNITASGTGACTDWDAQPPVITFIQADDDNPAPLNQIDLLAGTTQTVTCNITVYDYNGYSTIGGANATFYYLLNNSDDPDNNNTHYSDMPCTETGNDGGYNKYFSCSFNILYHANNGTWICNATTWDLDNPPVSSTDTTTVNLFAAVNVTSLIDFGNLQTGDTSPADVSSAVTNLGNTLLDIALDGYAQNGDDKIAMNCSDGNNITMSDERYNITSGLSWASMTSITNITTTLSGFNLEKQTNSTIPTKNLYWKLRATPPTIGFCRGVLVYTAVQG